MKIIVGTEENENAKAWMLGRNGQAIAVVFHPYGGSTVYENADAALFLNTYHKSKSTTEFVNYFLAHILIVHSQSELLGKSDQEIKSEYYQMMIKLAPRFSIGDWFSSESTFTKAVQLFVGEYNSSYFHNRQEAMEYIEQYPNKNGNDISMDLNQSYIRVRVGGRYNSSPSGSSVYFRIGSNHFDWYDIIYQFVYDRKNKFSDITIERDNQSDQWDANTFQCYRNRNGQQYSHMPIDEFLSEEKSPVLSSTHIPQSGIQGWVSKRLLAGASFSDLLSLPANRNNIFIAYKRLRNAEIEELCTKVKAYE